MDVMEVPTWFLSSYTVALVGSVFLFHHRLRALRAVGAGLAVGVFALTGLQLKVLQTVPYSVLIVLSGIGVLLSIQRLFPQMFKTAPAEKPKAPQARDVRTKKIEKPSRFVCKHGPAKGPVRVTVLGVECCIKSSHMCRDCTEKYLDLYSAFCTDCKRPIFPGDSVEAAGNGREGYVHSGCGDCAAAFCGKWGEGVLVPHPALVR